MQESCQKGAFPSKSRGSLTRMKGDEMLREITQESIAQSIVKARETVILLTPSVSVEVAESLVQAKRRGVTIGLFLDVSRNSLQRGYGDVEAMDTLRAADIVTQSRSGLMLSYLRVDERSWLFSPIPEAYIGTDEVSVNAISLDSDQAEALEGSTGLLEAIEERLSLKDSILADQVESAFEQMEREVEQHPIADLSLLRETRVYRSHIQYVEIEFLASRPGAIRKPLSKALSYYQNRVNDPSLTTSIRPFEGKSALVSEQWEDAVKRIKADYIRSVKSLGGNVALRKHRGLIESELQSVRNQIASQRKELIQQLKEYQDSLIERYCNGLLERVQADPPVTMKMYLVDGKLEARMAENWIRSQLRQVLPNVEKLVNKVTIKVTVKDVTYEGLSNEGLLDELREAFPYEEWITPKDETDALVFDKNW